MSDRFQKAQELRRDDAEAIDRGKHRLNLLTAAVLGVIAAGALFGAVVMRSPVGILGALVALGSPWCWMRADRNRVDEISADHRDAYAREFGWTLVAIALLVGGYALFIAAAVNGW